MFCVQVKKQTSSEIQSHIQRNFRFPDLWCFCCRVLVVLKLSRSSGEHESLSCNFLFACLLHCTLCSNFQKRFQKVEPKSVFSCGVTGLNLLSAVIKCLWCKHWLMRECSCSLWSLQHADNVQYISTSNRGNHPKSPYLQVFWKKLT